MWVWVSRRGDDDDEEEEEEAKEDGTNRRDTTPRQCPITTGTMGAIPHTSKRNAYGSTQTLAELCESKCTI